MKGFWAGHPELAGLLERVRSEILDRAGAEEGPVPASVRRLVESNGKMLRPAFVLLSASFGRPDPDKMKRLAAAVEMLHMATLVHDDIIDEAVVRRGISTLHALSGSRAAVLVGDWLFAGAFSLIADYADADAARGLARLVSRLCASEIRQSADRYKVDPSIRRYLRTIAGKTALLFSLSFYVGARESGCDSSVSHTLRRLGYSLGMGFQVIDDILDFEGTDAVTGKPTGSDLAQGIFTLPVVLGLRADDGALAEALASPPYDQARTSRIAALIAARGGLEGARRVARAFTERSQREIARLPDTAARATLASVAEKLLHRTY
jgi:heptaprenyl diphosphate synthase